MASNANSVGLAMSSAETSKESKSFENLRVHVQALRHYSESALTIADEYYDLSDRVEEAVVQPGCAGAIRRSQQFLAAFLKYREKLHDEFLAGALGMAYYADATFEAAEEYTMSDAAASKRYQDVLSSVSTARSDSNGLAD